uniref:Ig-like domain-containing protein n=1 Tax=Cyanoderma ruficeps TaxID=181631 RepID=A0A8C3R149_9PASS
VHLPLPFSLLILLLLPQEISAVSAIPHSSLSNQGHTFHTTCKYQNSNFGGLFWYQLWKGQGPQLLSYQAGTGPKHSGRITTHLNTTGKSSVLRVQQVELSDSALYLCHRAAASQAQKEPE